MSPLKRKKRLLLLFFVIITAVLLSSIYIYLNKNRFDEKIKKIATETIEKTLGHEVSIEKVSIDILNHIVINELQIKDEKEKKFFSFSSLICNSFITI